MNYDVEFTFTHTPYTIILVVNTYMYTRICAALYRIDYTRIHTKSYYRGMCIAFSLIIIDA